MKRLFLVCAMLAASVHADDTAKPWYLTKHLGMEVGPTGAQWGSDPRDVGYAAKFNGGEIARKLHEIGAEYLVIWGRDHEWAYYNSKLMPKCPGMGDRDVIQEAVDAAKPLGMPVIVYTVVQAGGYAIREHPEWRMVGADGKPIEGRVCFNSGYRQFMLGLIDEMLAYDIQGFHVDMLDQGFGQPYGCWCENCRKLFEKEYDEGMPTGYTWDEKWAKMLDFRANTSARFEDEIAKRIRDKKPGISVDFNYHGNPPFSFEVAQRPIQHAHRGDFITGECGVWGFGALSPSYMATFYRSTNPTLPYQVVMQRGVRMYHDQTTRPLNDLRWEAMTLLAHGAQLTIVDKTPFDGGIDPLAYGRMGEVFEEAHAKMGDFGQPPVEEVGLYFSVRSRDWFARENKEKYLQPFAGAHKAMVYEHLPTGFCFDENVNLERLRQFKVVVLPNVPCLTEAEVALLEQFVQKGGQLVVTGLSGLYSPTGEACKDSALERLIGAKLERVLDSEDNWFSLANVPYPEDDSLAGLPRPSLLDDIDPGWPLLCYGPGVVYTPTTAEPLGKLLAPIRTTRQREGKEGTSFPSSFGDKVGPLVLTNRYGKGTVITLAVDPGSATASEYRQVEARLLLRNAIRLLDPTPRVRIDAPRNVETVVTDDPATRTLRVHFLSYLSPPGATGPQRPLVLPDTIEDTPIFRATVNTGFDIARAEAFDSKTQLERTLREVSVLVENIHDVLRIHY